MRLNHCRTRSVDDNVYSLTQRGLKYLRLPRGERVRFGGGKSVGVVEESREVFARDASRLQ